MIARSWNVNQDGPTLMLYYDHTPEWWGQAIWFYNKFTGQSVPQDVFEVAARYKPVPPHYDIYSRDVLAFWSARTALAETLLPSR